MKTRRWRLILSGILLGSLPNIYISGFSQNIFGQIAEDTFFIVALIIAWWLWAREVTVKNTLHKARLVFFGISLISFIFAFIDLAQFFFFSNPNWMVLSDAPPFVVIRGIPFLSVLTSFAIGGLFSLAERYLDLHAKGDI